MCQYPLFETILIIDGEIQHLDFHQQRVNNAFQYYFNTSGQFLLENHLIVPDAFTSGKVRCRIDYHQTGHHIAFSHYIPKKIDRLQCVYTSNLDYRFKYTKRESLNKLLTPQSDEVIIIHDGFVSDCTIGNLLFLKNNQWFSPKHYLLKGTQLSYLLHQHQVRLIEIKAEDLAEYEKVMIINALNPFDTARALPLSSTIITP